MYIDVKIKKIKSFSLQLPGVSFIFSRGVLNPKVNCGVLSNFTFSGQYVPGAENNFFL